MLVPCSAMLDVPRHMVEFLAALLAAHRKKIGTPRRSRALTPFHQAVMVLRWFREAGCVNRLAQDAGIPSPLTRDNRAHHRLLRSTRARGERAAAELEQRWRALKHVTLSPSRIGAITQAALVLDNVWK